MLGQQLAPLLALSLSKMHLASAYLSVYPPVPGLPPSPYYGLRVRVVGDEDWQDLFPLLTECTAEKQCNTTGFYDHLKDWSNTYVNLQVGDQVRLELEVTRLWGDKMITSAVVHPGDSAEGCAINEGRAFCVLHKQALFTIDINGQMDEQDTGKLPVGDHPGGTYDGPPIHTLTIFANPFVQDPPSPTGEGVQTVEPGTEAPEEGDWSTLYFLPGIHHIGRNFILHSNRSYYIPGDAILYGTMTNNKAWNDGRHIRIFGHGTLSGDFIPHPNYADPPVDNNEKFTFHPIEIVGTKYTRVEGITIANSAFHSLMLINSYQPDDPTYIQWVKIFTWRANGDGINPFGNALVEDSFIRTQDDSIYVNGHGIRRVVFWNDANGSAFVLSNVGNEGIESHPLVVEDCTVVYARATWHHWSGGRLFNMRGEGGGEGGRQLTFRNIRVEDPRPTLQHFFLLMEGAEPWSRPEEHKRQPGDLVGITFQNITIAAPSVLGEPDVLWGFEGGAIRDLVFENVVIGGEKIETQDHFYTNEFVFDLQFS